MGMMGMMLRAATLALAVAAAAAAACTSSADCGYLGACSAGACACDAGWAGPQCASLDLLPAPPDAGLRQLNSSNWCGTLLADPANASLWHSLNSDFDGCGLNVWLSGSRVLHSISTSGPLGPYTPVDVAVQAEAHNPQAIRAPDGQYLLFDSYAGPDGGCPRTANYTTCTGGKSCGAKGPGAANFTFHAAPTPSGPWQPVHAPIDFPCLSKNLTPTPVFHPNGTLYIIFHCDSDGESSTPGDLVMVAADDWRGPFRAVNGGHPVWRRNGLQPWPEDPFLFLRPGATGVTWHVLLHNGPQGIHLYSTDGLNFTVHQSVAGNTTQPPYVYPSTINQTDGTVQACNRRERPWLLFDPVTGAPQALVTAVVPSGSAPGVAPGGTFTHVQAVGGATGGCLADEGCTSHM